MLVLPPQMVAQIEARKSLPNVAHRKAIRSAAGVSQASCADICNVTTAAFSQWENGTRTPRGEHLTLYVALLDALQQAVSAA